MNGFDKMNKKLLASQVEDALMDDILNKPVPIGEKIPNEYELAEMYGVGRSTIRETVKSLVSKGILEVRQGSGTYVIGTDTLENDPLGFSKYEDKYKLALELFEVRLMLEPEIAALAAQKATEQDKEYIENKYHAVVEKVSEIDDLINEKCEGWKTTRMNKVDLTILRLAVYEIKWDEDVPTGVAINEAVELSKRFSGEEGPAFVNGVLAKIAN